MVRDCHSFADFYNFANKANSKYNKTKIMPFLPLCCVSEAKKIRLGHRAGVFIWENFHPGYRDLGNRASTASHMNTSIFLQRKQWRGEISETVPTRLTGLI